MKQIVDKLNKIAKAIDESVELPTTDLIIDSLDAITTAYGGTPNDSNLIVDKLDAIAEVAHGGITPTGTITITENTEPGSPLDIAQYRYADVSVSGGSEPIILNETTITPEEMQGLYIGSTGVNIDTLLFPSIDVIYNGTSYTMSYDNVFGYGDYDFDNDMPDFTNYPLYIGSNGMVITENNGSYLLEIKGTPVYTTSPVALTVGGNAQTDDMLYFEYVSDFNAFARLGSLGNGLMPGATNNIALSDSVPIIIARSSFMHVGGSYSYSVSQTDMSIEKAFSESGVLFIKASITGSNPTLTITMSWSSGGQQ